MNLPFSIQQFFQVFHDYNTAVCLSHRFGPMYPSNPTFGAPCPTTIFTVGIFVFMESPFPKGIMIIPALWCAIGTSAALWLRVPQDLGLSFAGLITLLKCCGREKL